MGQGTRAYFSKQIPFKAVCFIVILCCNTWTISKLCLEARYAMSLAKFDWMECVVCVNKIRAVDRKMTKAVLI